MAFTEIRVNDALAFRDRPVRAYKAAILAHIVDLK